MVDYIRNERALLDRLRYEGIASLHFTFQDALSLYLGLELCPNGGWGLGGGVGGGLWAKLLRQAVLSLGLELCHS